MGFASEAGVPSNNVDPGAIGGAWGGAQKPVLWGIMRAHILTDDAVSMNRQLVELLGHERRVQVEFLLALADFDQRRLYLDLGYSSLWDYCIRALHLREGATFLRTHAVAMLRRFPVLA